MSEPLSQREFDTWRESDRAFKERMLTHLDTQEATNIAFAKQVSRLETYREQDAIKLGIFSTLISATFGAFAAFWSR